MWILEYIPHWVYWTLLTFSTIAVATSWSQSWRNYNFLVVIFCVGCLSWFSSQDSWKAELVALQQQAAVIQQQSAQVNQEIQTKTVTKIKKVKEIEYVNRDIIKTQIVKELDSTCALPESAVMLHNSASQNAVATSARDTAGTASTVKASELLDTVVENYGACHENAAKLEAWQEWYREQKKIFESVK
jgi:hypothetical protein